MACCIVSIHYFELESKGTPQWYRFWAPQSITVRVSVYKLLCDDEVIATTGCPLRRDIPADAQTYYTTDLPGVG